MTKPARIISRSRETPRRSRTLYSVMTLIAWALYAYLWLPLITLVAWWLGVRTSYVELHVRDSTFDPTLVVTLPLLALLCACLLIGWAEWNRWRFRDKDRRSAHDDVALPDVAQALNASLDLGQSLANAKSAVLSMDAEGRPTGVRVDRPLTLIEQVP